MKLLRTILLTTALSAPTFGAAQGLFSPAIIVNDSVITTYELDQRARLLELFNTNGDVAELAREQLIDDRLRLDFIASQGLGMTDEALATAISEFANRTGRNTAELTAALASEGISYESLRDYVKANTIWRDYIRRTYASRLNISDSDIDAEMANDTGYRAGLSVLLSEIIIPAPAEQMQQAQALAAQISEITSISAFSAAAAEYSAVPTREDGGRLPWRNINEFPEGLQSLLAGLEPGQTTPPLTLEGAIAILQLRSKTENAAGTRRADRVEYAQLTLPIDAEIAGPLDRCDDLYGIAQPYAADVLVRETAAPSQLNNDLALLLARMDINEFSVTDNGAQKTLTMLCDRSVQTIDRETVTARLRSQILNGHADTVLAGLRDNAVIVYK